MVPSPKLLTAAAAVLLLFGFAFAASPERDDCYTTTTDPKTADCVIEKESPELWIRNFQNTTETVSVRISNNSTLVYERTFTISDGERRKLGDIIRNPGEYTVLTTLQNGYEDSFEWTVGARNCVDCPRIIRIHSDSEVEVIRGPHQ